MTNTSTLNKRSKNNRYWPALISAIALILMTFSAFFAYGYAHSSLFTVDDPALTLSNIANAPQLLQAEIAAWGLIVILDVIVSWGFYTYLKDSSKKLAAYSALLRLFYTAGLGFALLELLKIPIQSLTSVSAMAVYNSFVQFETIWSMGLIVFGAHLLVTGLAVRKAPHIPKIFSPLLMLAGVSYIVVHSLYNFLPSLEGVTSRLETGLSLPMVIEEIGFGLWLLFKGKSI